jgi:hypothetical protein
VCGKKCAVEGVACARCRNVSFEHLANDQIVSKSPCVDVPVVQQVLKSEVECVPLSVFTRAGKRGHYE